MRFRRPNPVVHPSITSINALYVPRICKTADVLHRMTNPFYILKPLARAVVERSAETPNLKILADYAVSGMTWRYWAYSYVARYSGSIAKEEAAVGRAASKVHTLLSPPDALYFVCSYLKEFGFKMYDLKAEGDRLSYRGVPVRLEMLRETRTGVPGVPALSDEWAVDENIYYEVRDLLDGAMKELVSA